MQVAERDSKGFKFDKLVLIGLALFDFILTKHKANCFSLETKHGHDWTSTIWMKFELLWISPKHRTKIKKTLIVHADHQWKSTVQTQNDQRSPSFNAHTTPWLCVVGKNMMRNLSFCDWNVVSIGPFKHQFKRLPACWRVFAIVKFLGQPTFYDANILIP
jgi:hypothetical protein